MKMQPPDTSDVVDDSSIEPCESIPMSLQYSNNVNFVTQVVTVNKVRRYLGLKDPKNEIRETSGYWSSSSDDMGNARKLSARDQTQTRIAFGTKVAVETPRSGRTRNSSYSAHVDRGKQRRSFEPSHHTSAPRKVHSSKARLQGQTISKEVGENLASRDSLKDKNISLQVPNRPKVPKLESTPSPNEPISSRPKRPSLISLIDEIDLADSQQNRLNSIQGENHSQVTESSSKVFGFTSQPHSLPRKSIQLSQLNGHLNSFFANNISKENEKDRIQQKILRTTPTPRSAAVSPKTLRKAHNVKTLTKSNAILPPSSMSPDLSLSHSGNSYDRSKYSDETPKETAAALNKSVLSLKSSDATLTESVDTLVQTSLIEEVAHERRSPTHDITLQSPEYSSSQHAQLGTSLTVSNKSVREVPVKTAALPESSGFQVGTWNESFEAQMLQSMKRAVEEEMRDPGDYDDETSDDVDYQAKFEDSFGASWSTYKNPPPMHPQDYDYEMKKGYPISGNILNESFLSKSNPRDWGNPLSPPLVLPSVRTQQKKESLSDADSSTNDFDVMALSDGSSCVSYKSSTTAGDTDEEEMLDLLYDPCLNCYFDPKTGKYYELKN